MKKVVVIGSGGAGKSTFARRLGSLLELDVIHLDSLYWSAGWVEMPKPEWRETVERLLNRSAWILDGNYSGTLEMRLAACDTVIFLDVSRMVCVASAQAGGLIPERTQARYGGRVSGETQLGVYKVGMGIPRALQTKDRQTA